MPTIHELVVEIDAKTGELKVGLNKANSSLRKFGNTADKETKRAKKGFSTVKLAVSALSAAMAIRLAGALSKTSVSFEALNNKMLASVGSAELSASSIDFIREMTDRLGLSFIDTADQFASFAASGLRAGMSLNEVKEVFEGTAMAATALQLPAERVKLVFNAISQMSAKGVVSMEEMRQQMGESLPIAIGVGAKAMGMLPGAFIAAVSAGKIMSKDFLPKFGRALKEEMGDAAANASQSAQAGMNRLGNAINDLKLSIGKAGFMTDFTDSVSEISKAIQDEDVVVALGGVTAGISELGSMAVTTASKILSFTSTAFVSISKLIGSLAGIQTVASIDVSSKFKTEEALARIEEFKAKKDEILGRSDLGGDDDEKTPSIFADATKIEEELETLRLGFMSKEQIEMEHHENRIAAIQNALEVETSLTAKQKKDLLRLETGHQKSLDRMNQSSRRKEGKDLLTRGRQMLGVASQNSKKMFAVQKAYDVAEATKNAVVMAMDAYKFGNKIGGPAVGASLAAVAGAVGAGYVSSIAGASFGGGGGGSAPGGGGTPVISDPVRELDSFGLPADAEPKRVQEVTINVQGSTIGTEQLREIADGLNDVLDDGFRLEVNQV